jgi:serine/threonine protein kinase
MVGKPTPPPAYVTALKQRGFMLGDLEGAGGYGSVYRAEQASLARPVAVKFFDRPHPDLDEQTKRHAREAKLLARVSHPGIPYVITTGKVASQGTSIPYTVMEFVEGISLDELITASGGALEIARAAEIIEGVLSALEAAHASAVVHRDVKPDNIIVGSFGIYLIDFSIGFCMAPGVPGFTRITHTGSELGTWDYAAPEQHARPGAVDARADLYSTGIVLFEAITGHTPTAERLDSQLLGILDPDVRTVLGRALRSDRDERYASAREFREALSPFLGRAYLDLEHPTLSLCPNTRCGGAVYSDRGYFRGPRLHQTRDQFCDTCGTQHERGCRKCGRPFQANLADLIISRSKGEDARSAFCGRCGGLIFENPTCKSCGSFLLSSDMGSDTSTSGCGKCRHKPEPASLAVTSLLGGAPAPDDDIPF